MVRMVWWSGQAFVGWTRRHFIAHATSTQIGPTPRNGNPLAITFPATIGLGVGIPTLR